MAETYLSDKENAFKETEAEKQEETATKKEILALFKSLLENQKPVKKE